MVHGVCGGCVMCLCVNVCGCICFICVCGVHVCRVECVCDTCCVWCVNVDACVF